jgi:hypothetical protein
MANEDDVRPWDRRPNETVKAYAAFQTYLDQGVDRSYVCVAKALGRSGTWIEQWGRKHEWPARAAAWDSMPRHKLEEAYEDMAREIAEDHRRVATKLLRRLESGMDMLPDGKAPSQTWTMAHGAARQGHQFATDLSKPKDTAKDEITKRIQSLLEALAGDA